MEEDLKYLRILYSDLILLVIFQNGQEMVQHLDVRMERFRDVLVDQSVELLEELELINL